MAVLGIIFGVLMIFMGISLMCTPVATFLSAGYFITIMLLVYGVMGIVKACQKRSNVFDTVMSVLAVIVGIIALVRPGGTLVIDGMLLYMVAFWFVLRGIFAVVVAVKTKEVNRLWVLGVIIGILSVILGIYSFAHPMVTAITTGILIGLYFVESGIDMIVFGTTFKKIEDAVKSE
jgi:uncharacterized membrane protein HdeD (DUF308 family)